MTEATPTLDSIPPVDLSGKTCLVTGGNVGLGYETVKYLAQFGGRVIFTSRNIKDSEAAKERIVGEIGAGSGERLVPAQLDLADLKGVKKFADVLDKEGILGETLDVLILNAGIYPVGKLSTLEKTVDGFEVQNQVNYLAHFLLIQLLLPKLLASAKAGNGPYGITRIVSTSSGSSMQGTCDLDNMNGEKSYSAFAQYGNTKLWQVMMTVDLAGRLGKPERSKIAVHAVHPGFVKSNIMRDINDRWYVKYFAGPLMGLIARTPHQGAATGVWAATSKLGGETTGEYWDSLKIKEPNPLARDFVLCKKLYEKSLKDLGLEKSGV